MEKNFLGCNVGFEEDGKGFDFARPVLIVRKFNEHFFIGVPLSTTSKTGRYYYRFESSPGCKTALLSQVRALGAKRLVNNSGLVSSWDFAMVKLRLVEILL